MESIKVLLDFRLDNQTRAEHRRLLHDLAGEIAERLEYLDELGEDEREKPGNTPSEKANRRRPTHKHTSPFQKYNSIIISAASISAAEKNSTGSEEHRVSPKEENPIR